MINTVAIEGRLTKDGELRFGNNGGAFLVLSVAHESSVKRGDEWEKYANFFDCVVYGKYAEVLADFATKGRAVAIQGELRQKRWEDKEGNKRNAVDIKVTSAMFGLEPKGSGGQKSEEGFEDDIPF